MTPAAPDTRPPTARRPARPVRRARTAFTFVEVLFAVIILGIGMIMVAAMLPVAIRQGELNQQDVRARAIAESGFSFVSAVATVTPFLPAALPDGAVRQLNMPATVAPVDVDGDGAPDQPGLYTQIRGNQVSRGDPRFAWVAFYARPALSTTSAQVWVFALQRQFAKGETDRTFLLGEDVADLSNPANVLPTEVEESVVPAPEVRVYDGRTDSTGANGHPMRDDRQNAGSLSEPTARPDVLVFDVDNAPDLSEPADAAVQDAFVIVAETALDAQKRHVGRVFRLGRRVPVNELTPEAAGENQGRGKVVFELQPGFDLPARRAGNDSLLNEDVSETERPDERLEGGCAAYIIGRGYDPETDAFRGASQGLAVIRARLPLNAPE